MIIPLARAGRIDPFGSVLAHGQLLSRPATRTLPLSDLVSACLRFDRSSVGGWADRAALCWMSGCVSRRPDAAFAPPNHHHHQAHGRRHRWTDGRACHWSARVRPPPIWRLASPPGGHHFTANGIRWTRQGSSDSSSSVSDCAAPSPSPLSSLAMGLLVRLRSSLPLLTTQASGPPAHVLESIARQRKGILNQPKPTSGPPGASGVHVRPADQTTETPLPPPLGCIPPGHDSAEPPTLIADDDHEVDLEKQPLLDAGASTTAASAAAVTHSPTSLSFASTPQSLSPSEGSRLSIWCNNEDACGVLCVVMTWFLLLWPNYILYTRILSPWESLWETYHGWLYMAIYQVLAGLALYAHWKAMTTDPGSIPYGCLPIVPPPESGLYPSCVHCAYNYKPPRAHRQ